MKRFVTGLALALALVGAWGFSPGAQAAAGGQQGPQVVKVGIFVENLSDIDLKAGSFQADFYLFFSWTGEHDPTQTFEFTNTIPLELSAVPTSVDEDGTPKPDRLDDGSFHQILHVHGRFLGDFDINDYPLDDARLLISIEDKQFDSSAIVYEVDAGTGMSERLRVNGWKVREPVGTVTDHHYATTFGYPGPAGEVPFSKAEFSIGVTRPGITLVVQSTFPLIVIIFAALASLLIDARIGDDSGDAHWWFLATRLSLAVPAVIAAVALQFSAAPGVPREGQVLLIDKIYLLSYAVILVIIAVTVMAHRGLRMGGHERAETIDRWSLRLLTPAYLGGIVLILLTAHSLTTSASLTVHVCSRDAPDRLATLLTDLAEVVKGLPCSVTVYDDSTTGSYRAVCAKAPLPVDHFGEDRRRALVGEAKRVLGIDSDLLAGSRPFGYGQWDLAGCRFTAMLDAAMARGSSALHLFLDDDLRLLPCRYADFDFDVDTEAIRRHLFASTLPDDRLVAAGVRYAGRADIALLEHVDASQVDGLVPALVTASPFLHPDSPGFSGGFLLTNQLSLRTVPLSRWYDEDWIWLRQLRIAGGELRPLDAPVVHAGDRTAAVSLAGLRYQFEGEVVDSAVRLCAEAGGRLEACLDYVPQALDLHIGRVEATFAGRSTRRHSDVVGHLLAYARKTSVPRLQDALRAHVERSRRWASAFQVAPVISVSRSARRGLEAAGIAAE